MKGVILLIRGTCSQFKFNIPYTLDQIDTARVTFWQCDYDGSEECALPITKTFSGNDWEEKSKDGVIYVTLNQIETLAFTTEKKAYVQFRALTVDGFAFASRIIPITVYPTKDETVMVSEV